jgi:hypothetical protein
MKKGNEQSHEIDNFLNYFAEKVEQFAKLNPELKTFVTISVGDDTRQGWATTICGNKTNIKDQINILEHTKNDLIDKEVLKFGDYLSRIAGNN